MKQTVNVNIAGISFILDRECYTILSNFLEQTKQSFINNVDCERLVADVEASIAEQILSVQSADTPVSQQVVIPIIEGLGGQVHDYRSQPMTEAAPIQTLTKRLYRNPKGAVFGGVCSGMSAYFNVDVVVFRLLFLVPFFFGGMSIIWHFGSFLHNTSYSINATTLLLYVILWIVVPQARNPRQKLEMVGENVTVDSIAATRHEPSGKLSGNAFTIILKIIAICIGIFLLISAITATCAVIFKISFEMAERHTPIHDILNALDLQMGIAALCCSALTLLPFIGIFYMIIGSALGYRRVRGVVWGIFGLWFLLLIAAFVYTMVHLSALSQISTYW